MFTNEGFMNVTVDAWNRALSELEPDDPGVTVVELASMLGVAVSTAREKAEKLVRRDKAKRGIGARISRDGKRFRVTVYQLLEEEEI